MSRRVTASGLGPPIMNMTGAKLADPRKRLELVTWNVGSFARHRTDVFKLLVSTAPHLLCLQECNLRNSGAVNALKAEMRESGYIAHINLPHNLVVISRRGLNVVPIRSHVEDNDFRMQRFALQVGGARVLVRHRHAPSDCASNRKQHNMILEGEQTGALVIDIGDFNDKPASKAGATALFPNESTWRLDTSSSDFTSCIDGAVVSNLLALNANVCALAPAAGVQHRAVQIQLGLTLTSTLFSAGVSPTRLTWESGPSQPDYALTTRSRLATSTQLGRNGFTPLAVPNRPSKPLLLGEVFPQPATTNG